MNDYTSLLPVACLCLMALCQTVTATQTQPLNQVKTDQKVIALTFDDGPEEQTLEFLKLFARENCKATFFMVGKRVEKHPAIVRKVFDAGHEIGNHAFSHKNLPELTAEQIETEIAKTQDLIKKVTGDTPKLFRAPNLAYDDKTWNVINRHNLTAFNASSSTVDWNKETTTEQIIERATKDLAPGAIILMHSWSKNTLEAMPEILRILKEQGYRFITISEMIKLETQP